MAQSRPRRISLRTTMLVAFLLVGAVPGMLLTYAALAGATQVTRQQEQTLRSAAAAALDKIDRNLFERYGDAQAFASNPALQNREAWYKPGDGNPVVAAANRYVQLYGFYPLTLVVDPAGRVIAVNDRDARGHPAPTAHLYGRSLANASWLKAALEGRYLEGGNGLTGTVVEDAREQDGRRLMVFAAPVKDAAGRTIAVWANHADMSLVDEIVEALWADLRRSGFTTARLALTRKDGGGLVERGAASAADPLAVTELSRGALGYPGLGWKLTVAVERSEALAFVDSLRWRVLAANVGSILVVVAFAIWLSRRLARPIRAAAAALEVNTSQLQESANGLLRIAHGLSDSSHNQASAIEETSAAMHEIGAILQAHAASSQDARARVKESTATVEQTRHDLGGLQASMAEVDQSAQAISRITKSMETIAFQTNLLALNASVEAARAGEAGAGFAVVAGEVRQLAQRASGSAHETSGFVSRSLEANRQSQERLGRVAESFQTVRAGVEGLLDLLDQIATGAREQTTGLQQIESALLSIQEGAIASARNAESSRESGSSLKVCAEQSARISAELETLVNGA